MRPIFGGFFPVIGPALALGCAGWLGAGCEVRGVGTSNEFGRPVARDFPPGRANINHLCQAVTQDGSDFIYIANSTFLRFYDGAGWRDIPQPTESAGVRKFAVAADGTVFLGGAGVIGYVRGAGEDKVYVSLADRLPPTARNYDDIYDVLAVGDTVYFADEEKILIWRADRFTVVPCPSPRFARGARLHRVGEAVYVTALDRALCRLVDDRLELVADDPVLRDARIITVEAAADGALVLLTADRGFYRLAAGRLEPLATEANRWLAGKTILRALRLPDGARVVAFTSVSGDGGMSFDAAGRYVGPLDQTIGLFVNTIRDFFHDREGGLWLGTETGVIRLEWPSAVSVFDVGNGLGSGAVADVVRHDGVLHAATAEGIYRLAPSDQAGRPARFEQVASFPVYSLLSHPAGVLAVGYADLFVQTPAGLAAVVKLPPGGGVLQRSKSDPDRLWIATTEGPRSMRRTAAGWAEEKIAPQKNRDTVNREFLADTVAADGAGPGVPHLPHLALAEAGAVAKVWEETDHGLSVSWICGARGLVRVEMARAFPPAVSFATLLKSDGVAQNQSLLPDHPGFSFSYLALRPAIADGVSYQTRLVGREEDWSPWGKKRERTFAGLSAGDYRFEVRARDAYGHLAAPAALAFSVLAPWWRTGWAWLGYAAIGAGGVAGIVQLSTRAVRRRADRLEVIVADRTAELAAQNAELVRLNQLELDEKITARLAEEKARLEVLRYQLNPHFLFNTLASISAALPAGASTPRTMVERLAEFCRLTLHRADKRDWTTLGEEVQLLRAYLEIEQSRWGALLDVVLACDPGLDAEPLPHFLLLPLVENALKYGRATSPDRVGLHLTSARAADGALVLTVANTGIWIEPAEKKTVATLGIGLDNLRERLARHYPRSHRLEFSHAAGWVTVDLRIYTPPVS